MDPRSRIMGLGVDDGCINFGRRENQGFSRAKQLKLKRLVLFEGKIIPSQLSGHPILNIIVGNGLAGPPIFSQIVKFVDFQNFETYGIICFKMFKGMS